MALSVLSRAFPWSCRAGGNGNVLNMAVATALVSRGCACAAAGEVVVGALEPELVVVLLLLLLGVVDPVPVACPSVTVSCSLVIC